MANLMAEFLPAGVFNVVCGERETGASLVNHKRPDMVSITGSVGAGIQVAESAAKQVKRVHLELGGKAPVVVFADEKTSIQLGLESVIGARESNGPLAAIIDAMESTTSTFQAFAPNDTPFFTAHNFAALLAKLEDSKADVVVATDATDASQAHWLLSVWRKESCLPKLLIAYERGVRSVHGAVKDLHIASVSFDANLVRNVNAVSDLSYRGTI
jgi:molybdopterin-guanine dinucleotide biosynthesis protein A